MSSEDLVREAQDPATPAARLAELAQADRATWPAIVFHPNAYDGLLQWLGERGDPTISAALAARTSHAATLQSAAPAAAAPVEPTPAAPVAATPVEPEPVAPASPVAEPVVPVAGQTDGQAAEPTSPVAEPTVVIPAEEPAPAQAAASEPTSVFSAQPAQPAYPAAQPAYPAAQPLYAEAQPAQTAAFGAVPPGGDGQPPAGTPGGGAKKSLPVAAVIALTVLVVLLIGGAAFGATKIFGGDDDDPPVSAGDNKTTDAPDADDETDEPSDPTPTPSATTDAPGGTGSSSEFCTELGNIQTKSLEAFSGGSTPDLSKIQDTARELVEAYDDLGDIAPPEIKSDIEVMSKFLNSMMNPSGGAPTGMDEYIGAAQRIGTYYAQNCL